MQDWRSLAASKRNQRIVDQRGPVGAGLGSLGEPVVELHRLDIVPIMPKRHKGAPSEDQLHAPIGWSSGEGDYEDIRYETGGGIAKVTIARRCSMPSGHRR